jgi:hypothetical protein
VTPVTGPRRLAAALPGLLLLSLMVFCNAPGRTEAAEGRVDLMLSKLPPQGSAGYKAIRRRAGNATGQILSLTKAEMWSVPRNNVAEVKRAASELGAVVDELAADWNYVFRPPPLGLQLDAQQEAMLQHARGSKATTRVGIVAMPPPALVEYALTKDVKGKHTASGGSKILVALGEATLLTLTRTSVDIKPDMCIWRGAVDGTDMPVTIMWWPGGKMAGLIRHHGHSYSIRHIGGEVHAIIETNEDLMPEDHAPPRPRSEQLKN